jgi:hypothetical protein
MDRMEGVEQHLPSAVQAAAGLAAKAHTGLFTGNRRLEFANNLRGQKVTDIWRLDEASVGVRHTAVRGLLTQGHQLQCLTSAEDSLHDHWDSHILTALRLVRKITGRYQFTHHRESVAAARVCSRTYAVIVCLLIAGVGFLRRGWNIQSYRIASKRPAMSIIYKTALVPSVNSVS